MPRIIQLTPDGGGRYIAVDRDGDLCGVRRSASRTAARSTFSGSRCPPSSRGTTDDYRHLRRRGRPRHADDGAARVGRNTEKADGSKDIAAADEEAPQEETRQEDPHHEEAQADKGIRR
jgi:hypothetical protein